MPAIDLTTHREERELLEQLDGLLLQRPARTTIDAIIDRVERQLAAETVAPLAWEPVPLAAFGADVPDVIRSSWVFIVRAVSITGAERHPNSHQRVMSYRGLGDLQVMHGDQWWSHPLVSDPNAVLERRWLSIPPHTWHQAAVVGEANWVVVSFHTVPAHELIEERPEPGDPKATRRRSYLSE
jgi:hypothetical protein